MKALQDLALTVLTISATCSAALLPLLLLCPRLQKRVAARSFHVLFFLLALRLLIPVRLSLPQPAVTVTAPSYTVTVPAAAPAVGTAPAHVPAQVKDTPAAAPALPAPAVRTEREIPLTAVLGAVWLCGTGLCLLGNVGLYLLSRRRLLRGAYTAEAEAAAQMEALAQTLGLRRFPALLRAPNAPGPLTVGLLHPAVILPEREYDPSALDFILRHELTHLRRRDVAYKALLSLACAVHWFNPLVWWMARTAGRNLELCCDDDVLRTLPPDARRGYGAALLDAAEGRPGRTLALSTCFGGGKKQMKARLGNLFAHKKASAVLVCVVLGCALLLGGLIACETASASGIKIGRIAGLTSYSYYYDAPVEDGGRGELYQKYIEENFQPDFISVILADMTGDGQNEMIVVSLTPAYEESPVLNMRQEINQSDFTGGYVQVFGIVDGAVVPFAEDEPGFEIFSAHAGWGCVELVPLEDGSWAILHFSPWEGQGIAAYSYNLYAYESWGGRIFLDSGEVLFTAYGQTPLPLGEENATPQEVEAFLETLEGYRAQAIPLLDYYEGAGFCYLNMRPEDAPKTAAFLSETRIRYLSARPEDTSGAVSIIADALRDYVVGEPLQFTYAQPFPIPATAEEAVQLLEGSVTETQNGYAFYLPDFDGEWSVQITGILFLEAASHPAGTPDLYMPVHYLESEVWNSGQVYSFNITPGYYTELTMDISVTAPDGTRAERSIALLTGEYGPYWAALPE